MPNYNGAEYLESSILSVINQTYNNWELIIIDDASTDDSCDKISKLINYYSNNDIKLISLEKPSGTPGVPRNHGINIASGNTIAFLDSDDIWCSEKLSLQVEFMQKFNSNFSFTSVLEFSNEGIISNKRNIPIEYNINEIKYQSVDYYKMLRKCFIKSCSTSMITKQAIGSIRFNPDSNFKAVEDYLFWLDILKYNVNYAHNIDLCLTYYRTSENSISRSKIYMIKQNAKVYKYIFNNNRFKWFFFIKYMTTYAFLSIFLIMKRKLNNLVQRKFIYLYM